MTSFPSDAKGWLGKLVSFDTTSYKSNLPLLDCVRDYLKTYNIESTYVYNPEKTHANLFATIPASDGATQGGIILSGHTDVVPVDGQKWDTDPFTMVEKDGKLYGRGTCDMKGYIAVCLSLVPVFVKMQRSKPIHFAFSFNEEVGCTGVPLLIDYLKEKGFNADCCVIGEPTEMKLYVGNKGRCQWIVKVHGQAIHSSLALMNTSCNAIEYAAKIIAKIREIALKLREDGPHDKDYSCPFPCITTGIIKGGNAVNTVPAECEFTFGIRITDQQTSTNVEHQVKTYINDVILPAMRKEYANASIDIVLKTFYPPFNNTCKSELINNVCKLLSNTTSYKMGGGTEAGYFQEHLNIESVIVGPGSMSVAHMPNEFVLAKELSKCKTFMEKIVKVIVQHDSKSKI